MSAKDPLTLAREFVATVERFATVPGMMASYDLGKLAICRALIELHERRDEQLEVQAILAFAPPPPLYWELRIAVRSHRWNPTIELWRCCSDHDDGTCDEEPFLVFSVSGMTLPDALKNAAEMAAKVET